MFKYGHFWFQNKQANIKNTKNKQIQIKNGTYKNANVFLGLKIQTQESLQFHIFDTAQYLKGATVYGNNNNNKMNIF